ncbi:unnamed protein product [Urochloa humidicola]
MASSRRSRCAACKDLRRQCTDTCTYAPYFPNGKDKEEEFALVKRVFDLVRIQTLLSGTTRNVPVPKTRMYDFVAALVQEAEVHTSDPITGGIPNLVELLIKLKGAREELNAALMPQDDATVEGGMQDSDKADEPKLVAVTSPGDGGPSKKARME